MGVKSTYTVKKTDAIAMLKSKGIHCSEDDSNSRLGSLLDENTESDFENYWVVDDMDYDEEEYDMFSKSWW